MSNPAFAAIILAAGEGTRLNSAIPKVLHELAGWPLIRHVTEALRPLGPAETVVVIGQGMEAVARAATPAKTAPSTYAATGKSVNGGWVGFPDQPRSPLNFRPRSVNVGRNENFRTIASSPLRCRGDVVPLRPDSLPTSLIEHRGPPS